MTSRSPRPLAVLAAILVVAWGGLALADSAGTLSADVAYRDAAAGQVTLIDVRSPEEWRETGVPQYAKTVTIHNLDGPEAFVAEVLATVEGDRTRPIALICAAGVRSRAAQRFLEANGFSRLLNVAEGVFGNGDLPGWRARGLPMEPCTDC